MIFFPLLLLLGAEPSGVSAAAPGQIAGIVVNGSAHAQTVAQAEVMLRVRTDGPWAVLAETTSDRQGRFVFAHLPVGKTIQYQCGANRAGIHYPGARLRLTAESPRVLHTLTVYDTVAGPSPLVARRHEIELYPQPQSLRVTETILIDNPTLKCFVGESAAANSEPVTLQLSIPPQFQQTTFAEEFFGRRFALARDKLVTAVPWPPGQRTLTFTYVLNSPQWQGHWQRPLDLPCASLRVRVHTAAPEEISCNLARTLPPQAGEAVFEAGGESLPAGRTIQVQMQRLTVPWMAYGRWIAAALLSALIAAIALGTLWQRRGMIPAKCLS